MYEYFERTDLILDFIFTMIFVVGRIILPYIPIALSSSSYNNFKSGIIPHFMSQLLTDITIIILLSENKQ